MDTGIATKEPIKRGAFIVLEGCDRAGKSTQCRMIVEKLNKSNIPAQLMVFPDRTTPIGAVINDYLKKNIQLPDQAIHLLFTANRWERMNDLKTTLNQGITVIVDRYSYSGVVYSAAKNESTTSLDWYKKPEEGLPKPDAVLFLHLEPEVMAERKGFGNERYELPQFQKSVAEFYTKLKDNSWKIIDANKSVEDLTVELVDIVKQLQQKAKDKPLELLW